VLAQKHVISTLTNRDLPESGLILATPPLHRYLVHGILRERYSEGGEKTGETIRQNRVENEASGGSPTKMRLLEVTPQKCQRASNATLSDGVHGVQLPAQA
jgi:hypothetical protein